MSQSDRQAALERLVKSVEKFLEPGGNIGLTTRRIDPLIEQMRQDYLALAAVVQAASEEAVEILSFILKIEQLEEAHAAIREAAVIITRDHPIVHMPSLCTRCAWLALPAVVEAGKL